MMNVLKWVRRQNTRRMLPLPLHPIYELSGRIGIEGSPNLGLIRDAGGAGHVFFKLYSRCRTRPHFAGRVLRVGAKIVKKFRQHGKNQELILAAFEEQAWQQEIDDPLPRTAGIVAKERLRQTIEGLNRHQKIKLLHFYGDGTGQRVGWEWRR